MTRALWITTAALCGVAILTSCQTARPKLAGPLIQSAATCADFTQTIYFEAGQATVTRPAEGLLALASSRAHGCAVTGVDVLGLSDAPGENAANLALSERRAEAVKAALHRRGFDKVEIKTSAAGATGALTKSGQSRPVRRQADVTFRLAPLPAR